MYTYNICFLSKRVCYLASCRIVNELLLNMDLSLGFETDFVRHFQDTSSMMIATSPFRIRPKTPPSMRSRLGKSLWQNPGCLKRNHDI